MWIHYEPSTVDEQAHIYTVTIPPQHPHHPPSVHQLASFFTLPPRRRVGTLFAFRNGAPENIEWFIEGQAFLRSFDSAPRPPLSPPSSVSKLDRRRKGRRRKRDSSLTGEGEWGEDGVESYDRKKAWPSINHSILSAVPYSRRSWATF